MLNWIKKRQEAVEAKPIVPKNRLYFLLLIGAIVLTGVSLLVQENVPDDALRDVKSLTTRTLVLKR